MTAVSSPADLARELTIPVLCTELGVPYRRLWRKLTRLHSADRLQTPNAPPWLYRLSAGQSPWYVNRSLLRNAHPELWDGPNPKELADRVASLEEQVGELTYQNRVLAKRIKGLGG